MNERTMAINTVVGYARSVLSALLGLFVVRWSLELLGDSDYGLYGVVGGIIFLFGFLTPVLQQVAARFYAYEIGKPDYAEETGRLWFNAVKMVSCVLSVILVGVTYVIGRYALAFWLTVPDGRLHAAVLALSILLLSALASMLSVPYVGMLVAKQSIALVAGVQLGQSVLTFVVVGLLRFALFNGRAAADVTMDPLVAYSVALAIVALLVNGLLVWFSVKRNPACRVDFSMWGGSWRLMRMLSFMGWQILGGAVWTVRSQFMVFFVNKCFGVAFNASYSVANQVSNQAGSLAANLNNAIAPVLTTEEGGGRRESMMRLARVGSMLSAALVLVFAVPIAAFIEPILKLWLKSPPPGCASLCVAMLVVAALRQAASGYGLAILAHGRLGVWQTVDAIAMLAAIPIAFTLWKMDFGVASVGWALVLSEALASLNRYVFAKRLARRDV